MQAKLILVTNDDGYNSPGLLAALGALHGLGEILVSAPESQQSSSGRAFYWGKRGARQAELVVGQSTYEAYAVDASPAVAVRYGFQLIAKRLPSLVVSGINYGENLGSGLTISGTVGAALEAVAAGIPALAVSLETKKEFHTSHSNEVDFATAAYFTGFFAKQMLGRNLPPETRLLNVNVPAGSTRNSAWRVTRASRQAYFHSVIDHGRFVDYDVNVDLATLESDSDIYALLVDRVVSVTPLTFDLTGRVEPALVRELLSNAHDPA